MPKLGLAACNILAHISSIDSALRLYRSTKRSLVCLAFFVTIKRKVEVCASNGPPCAEQPAVAACEPNAPSREALRDAAAVEDAAAGLRLAHGTRGRRPLGVS